MDFKIFSVSEITRQLKLLIEDSFPAVWVEGEISNFKPHHSGHLYFTVKDQNAQLSCVMWRSRTAGLAIDLANGLKVQVYGTLRLYEKSGRYQIDLLRIHPAGYGDLQLQFDLLKEKLHEEGLFDVQRKKPLPPFPAKIGIITSPTGAALQDILSVTQRRSPSTELLIYGVKVQGTGASEEIVRAINFFNHNHLADVLLIGRGGGSLEDLWAFNEEIVARAIFQSDIPIVSAIGHEIDFTIADFVADLRAPTPSAAAEIILPDDDDLKKSLLEQNQKLSSVINEKIVHLRKDLINIKKSYSFRRPKDVLQNYIAVIEDYAQRMQFGTDNMISGQKRQIENLHRQLENLNPGNIINRGYSMVFKDGKLVSSTESVAVDDTISVKLKDGNLSSLVLRKYHDKKKII